MDREKINNEAKDNDTKKIYYAIILIFVLMIAITSGTYAYFALSATNSNTITGTAATAQLNLTVTQIYPLSTSTNTGVMVPQYSYVNSADTMLSAINKHKCVDGNNNIVCYLYAISIKNSGTAEVVVNGTFKLAAGTSSKFTNLKWYRYYSSTSTAPTSSTTFTNPQSVSSTYGTLYSNTTTTLSSSLSLSAGSSAYYGVGVWIEETGSDQSATDYGTFNGTVSFVDASGKGGITSTITSAS